MIVVKVKAPHKATIEFSPDKNQIFANGVLRTPVNQFVNLQVKEGRDGAKNFCWRVIE